MTILKSTGSNNSLDVSRTFILCALSAALMFTLNSCKTLEGTGLDSKGLGTLLSAGEKIAKSGETSEADEIELGAHMAATLLGAAPLDSNMAAQRYVNRIGRYLASFSKRATLQWHFAVLADDGYNAFAAPGGYIFVTRGLLKDLRSEAELAGVLAHEINHVVAKHHLDAVQKGNRLGALSELGGAVIDRQIDNNSSGSHTALKKEAAQRVMNATKEIYSRGLDKDDEYESDLKGMKLAAKAGYDPYALIAVLQRLDAQSASDSNFALLFKTHPKAQDRLLALDKATDAGFAEHNYAVQAERYQREINY